MQAIPFHGLAIGQERVAGSTEKTEDLINPASGQPFARVAQAEPHDVDVAVRVAQEQYTAGEWSKIKPRDRS